MRQHWKSMLMGFAFFAPLGCTDFGPEGVPDLKIVFGESIAVGDFRGIYYSYVEGRAARLWIQISHDPSLGLGVLFVEAERPYPGRTLDGVGIDSDRGFVLSKVGSPDKTHSAGKVITDTYSRRSSQFDVTYENERVLNIKMRAPER